MKNNKLIIYIIGDGRSGSTILEEYLARNLGGLKIGEARRFWKYYYESETYCECGDRIKKCSFWKNVNDELPKDIRNLHVHQRLGQVMFNFRIFLKTLQKNNPEPYLKYVQNRFYKAIFNSTSANLIIDSSKIYPWGIYLDRFSMFKNNVLFIHLVRDIAVTANSWKKDVRLAEYVDKEVKMPKRTLRRHLKVWLKVNLSTIKYMKKEENYIYIDYKDFCNDPNKLLLKIKNHEIFDNFFFDGEVKGSHGIAGNPVRQETSEDLQIKYYNSTSNLNVFEKIVYEIGRAHV